MRSASYQPSSNRRRAAAFVLALAAHLLIVFVMLRLQSVTPSPPPQSDEKAFHLLPVPHPSPKAARAKAKTVSAVKHAKGAAAPRAPAPPHPAPAVPLNILPIELATSDISKMPSHHVEHAPAGGSDAGASEGSDSGAADGEGQGPGGERLYNAEWYTEPTHAQLAYYLPHTMPDTGYGIIACRTVERFRVEDCQIIGESPAGSGIARAVQEAAWQFRVLPPRIGGRAMIGTWVRIRIEYSRGIAEAVGRRRG